MLYTATNICTLLQNKGDLREDGTQAKEGAKGNVCIRKRGKGGQFFDISVQVHYVNDPLSWQSDITRATLQNINPIKE